MFKQIPRTHFTLILYKFYRFLYEFFQKIIGNTTQNQYQSRQNISDCFFCFNAWLRRLCRMQSWLVFRTLIQGVLILKSNNSRTIVGNKWNFWIFRDKRMNLILDDIKIGNPSYNYKRPDKSNSFEIGCHTLLFEICCDQHT